MTRTVQTLDKSHVDFRQSIRGQTARLPNFYSLFPEWEPRLHPDYDRARDEVLNPWIERWVPDADTSRKLQKADFGRFAAIMCPDASFEKMCTVGKAFAWVRCLLLPGEYSEESADARQYFIWDDLFDCGSLTHDKMAIPEYRDKSMQYFRAVLSSKEDAPDLSACSDELQKALLCWDEVAAHIRAVCSEARSFPRGTAEHSRRINDMFSLRKEIADNQIENLVPILVLNQNIDCSSAMERSSLLIQEAACNFHKVEKRLRGLSQHASNPVTDMFLQGCKDVVMGLTHWSYTGQRYFKQSEIGDDSVIEFRL
ncbi:hypothetical protein CNMCM7691_000133 [Aspergillus felis]|uniref:Terpene synthase n=1 Tax=Aspergillus felis TaxID=1287682 RepID=A0A8H6VAF5_9EURO|nr:hypothetical protein CNMCM7691_000133 [Aspergillus felis]